MKTLIIAGGNGFLGKILTEYFKSKVEKIVILSRSEEKIIGNVHYILWDGKTLGDWSKILDGSDVLINLAGKPVDCRYHQKNKDLILSSRTNSTKVLGQAIEECSQPPKVWLNSSTATIYRHSLDKEMDETTGEIGQGFSVDVATAWEQEFFRCTLSNTRQVALRTSIVLGNQGGAFPTLRNLTKMGFGGKQGNGKQKISWIHEEDFVHAVHYIIQQKEISGVINVVSPKPVTNEKFMRLLRKGTGTPFGIPMGKTLLKIGARIIQTEPELILKSRNVIPKRLVENGFQFNYESIQETITNLTSNNKSEKIELQSTHI
ncbi:MAG: TIGR01777 family oxidoreductase [Flavobacteriaceae bacterium]|nr:TIGR01777 family oxidoreductase [Flavobacteriaceae bacterium]